MKFTAALVALACGLTTLDAAQYIVTTNKARGVNIACSQGSSFPDPV
eukprot:CAMPEP_0119513566 /NCGR_PEP_ID=MMETSP1344-20130328/31642_1 /TAXON_ID=236787 /ORGANISM="Florenciella parvula, Strain CCMP2471" /LENGTH=46 /DNA_ID= /DNA_START= /DNA_END= /DNA_ORIENTATION=